MRLPGAPDRGAGREAARDRGQVPGPPHARGRGHVRRAGRAHLRRAPSVADRAARRPARPGRAARARGPRRASTPPSSSRSTSTPTARCTPSSRAAATTCAATRARSRSRAAARTTTTRPRATALREAHEEIGLPPDGVELVGALQPTPTFVTNYAIYPFVGLIEPGLPGRRRGRGRRGPRAAARDLRARLRAPPVDPPRAAVPHRRLLVDEHLIWGATARIVADLLERLEPVRLA